MASRPSQTQTSPSSKSNLNLQTALNINTGSKPNLPKSVRTSMVAEVVAANSSFTSGGTPMYRTGSHSGVVPAGPLLDPSDIGVPPHRASSPHLALPNTLQTLLDTEGSRSSHHSLAPPQPVPVQTRQPPPKEEHVKKPDPVLSEYEQRIKELEARAKDFELECKHLKESNDLLMKDGLSKVSDLSMRLENKDLETHKLIKDKQNLLVGFVLVEPVMFNNCIFVKNTPALGDSMAQRVEILIRENDDLVEQNRVMHKELDRLKKTTEKQADELSALSDEIAQTNHDLRESRTYRLAAENELQRVLQELSGSHSQIERLEAELKAAQEEHRSVVRHVEDQGRTLEEVMGRYQRHVMEAEEMGEREKGMIGGMKRMEAELHESQLQIESLTSQIQTLQAEREEFLKISKDFEKRFLEQSKTEAEMSRKMQAAIEEKQEAILERDKAVVRDQQLQAEIQRLNERNNEMAQKYRLKMEAEMTSLRAQFAQERRKLGEEISLLETNLANVQSQMDRALREKRSAESELEKLTSTLPLETDRLQSHIDTLSTQLRISERERLEALDTTTRLQAKLHKDTHRYEKLKEELEARVEETMRRLRKAEREVEDSKEGMLKVAIQLNELEHAHARVLEEGRVKEVGYEAEVGEMRSKHETKVLEMAAQLESMAESHSRALKELQEVRGHQREVGEQWKREAERLRGRYESVVADWKGKVERLEGKVGELEGELGVAERGRKEAVAVLEEERKAAERWRGAVRGLEGRVEGLKVQVEGLLRKEQEGVAERKALQREVDRLQLDKKRMERERAQLVRQHNQQTPYIIQSSRQDSTSDSDTSRDIKILKAEINRVKSRSQMRNYPTTNLNVHEKLLGNALMSDSDEDEEGEEDDILTGRSFRV
ncbi:hypothetical protein HDV05_000064 [Chytridiales sp. JEL 0842]|nr:hypothetical protein HDV05_000064 [Chytridiales sp. JEL 0842]